MVAGRPPRRPTAVGPSLTPTPPLADTVTLALLGSITLLRAVGLLGLESRLLGCTWSRWNQGH